MENIISTVDLCQGHRTKPRAARRGFSTAVLSDLSYISDQGPEKRQDAKS